MSKILRKIGKIIGTGTLIWIWAPGAVTSYATDVSLTLQRSSGIGRPIDMLGIMFLFLFLTVVPPLVVVMTSFIRIVTVLSFLHNALDIQQSPPNQIPVRPTLFLTLFIMNPVIASVNTQTYQPYREGQITREQTFERAQEPMKEFILKQAEKKSLDLFLSIPKAQPPDISQGQEGYTKLRLATIVPSSTLSELNKVFTMGLLIFILFLTIDLVVSSMLVSMDMVMLLPTMVTLPLKIMMFVLADEWSLVTKALVQSSR